MKVTIGASPVRVTNMPCVYRDGDKACGNIAEIEAFMWGNRDARVFQFCDHHYSEFTNEILNWLRTDGRASTDWYPQ